MEVYKYSQKTKEEHPSICFQCEKAVKPASSKIARLGYVGCYAHMEEIQRRFFVDADPESVVSRMLESGIQCLVAATGWSSAIPIDSDRKARATYNGILLINGCTKCPYFSAKQTE